LHLKIKINWLAAFPKDTPFQRLRRPDELNFKTEMTASQFCAVNCEAWSGL